MELMKSLVCDWHNAVFTANIVFWIIYLFITLIGGSDGSDVSHDTDMDGHMFSGHDVHHDVSHDGHPNLTSNFLNFLGIGRCPMSIVFMIMGISFGFTGLVCNAVFSSLRIIPAGFYFLLSASIALIVSMIVTSTCSRIVAKIMPKKGTTAIELSSLVGRSGESSITIDNKSGRARVPDQYGTLHNIYCRTAGDDLPIPPNTEVLVLFRDDENIFVVTKKPGYQA